MPEIADYTEVLRLYRKYRAFENERFWQVFVRVARALEATNNVEGKMTKDICDQCSEPVEGPHHPGCYRFVEEGHPIIADDLIPLFRDAASVNITEGSVERQAKRFADAVLSLYDVRHKGPREAEAVTKSTPAAKRWEVGKNGWDASDEITREDI